MAVTPFKVLRTKCSLQEEPRNSYARVACRVFHSRRVLPCTAERTRCFLLGRLTTGAHTDRRVTRTHTTSRHNGTPFRALSTVCKESAARVACSTWSSQPCSSSYDVLQQLMAVLLCSACTSTKRLGGCDPFLVRRRLAVCSAAVLANVELALLCLPCLLYTSPSPRDRQKSRMPSSA